MKKRILLMTVIALMLISVAGVGLASDYQPRPGVLSPEEVDFGGKTVTILVGDLGYTGFNGGEPLPERVQAAEALFNVKIETQSLGSSNVPDRLMSRIMANDSTLDVFRLPHRHGFYPLVSQGMLLPMSDYLSQEYYESLPNADRHSIEKLVYQNELYGFGVTYGMFNASMMFLNYNKDMIAAENLPDPYELYLAGEWSFETMTELTVAVTKDTDGDGELDQFGIEDRSVSHNSRVHRIAAANGSESGKLDENGKWVFAYTQPDALEVLSQITEWRKELEVTGGSFAGGTALFHTHNHIAGTRNYSHNFGIVPIPGSTPGEYKYPAFDFAMNMLPLNSEYPEGLIALVDYLFREEDGQDFLDYNINTYIRSIEDMYVLEDAVANWKGEGDPFEEVLYSVAQESIIQVINGERGAAAAMDEIAPAAQAVLDDLFNQ